MIEAIVLGWVFAILFALTAIVCAVIGGDRRYERDEARRERDLALAELAELRAGHTEGPAPVWHSLLPPAAAEFLGQQADLFAAEIAATIADLERHANSEQDQ